MLNICGPSRIIWLHVGLRSDASRGSFCHQMAPGGPMAHWARKCSNHKCFFDQSAISGRVVSIKWPQCFKKQLFYCVFAQKYKKHWFLLCFRSPMLNKHWFIVFSLQTYWETIGFTVFSFKNVKKTVQFLLICIYSFLFLFSL